MVDDPLDLRSVLAEIDRNRAETQKLFAEREKLTAEAGKLNRDRLLAPLIAVGGVAVGVVSALAALFAIILKH